MSQNNGAVLLQVHNEFIFNYFPPCSASINCKRCTNSSESSSVFRGLGPRTLSFLISIIIYYIITWNLCNVWLWFRILVLFFFERRSGSFRILSTILNPMESQPLSILLVKCKIITSPILKYNFVTMISDQIQEYYGIFITIWFYYRDLIQIQSTCKDFRSITRILAEL